MNIIWFKSVDKFSRYHGDKRTINCTQIYSQCLMFASPNHDYSCC